MESLPSVLMVLLPIAAIIVAIGARNAYRRKRRRLQLLEKYNDEGVVDIIMAGEIRQGMTVEQLIDSWGQPAARDEKIYKTKRAFTFKYNQAGRNRYRSRVKIENGVVVGWEQK